MGNMLYNGVELPNIESVWTDKSTFSFAFIRYWKEDKYVLFLSVSKPVVVRVSTSTAYLVGFGGKLYSYISSSNGWVVDSENNNVGSADIGLPIIWVSDDLLDSDDELYLAASDPVDPNAPTEPKWQFNLQDFLSGVAAGAASRGVIKRKPTAYLYNGVQLPVLPEEWNSDERPYAVIYADTQINKECLFVSKVPLILYDNYGDGNYTFSASGWGGSSPITFENEGTNWVEGFLYPQHIKASTYIWSNYDIVDKKGVAGAVGSVYREGSDPIPVYE